MTLKWCLAHRISSQERSMSELTQELDDVLKSRQTNGYHIRRIAGQARDEIERLRVEHLSNINLAISYLAQVAGMLNDGDIDKAQEFCYAAAESWTQNIAELEVVENRSAALAGAADQPSAICPACKGSGEDGYEYVEGFAVGPSPCRDCNGTGERAADPTNGATE
jgi:hypothetical protein